MSETSFVRISTERKEKEEEDEEKKKEKKKEKETKGGKEGDEGEGKKKQGRVSSWICNCTEAGRDMMSSFIRGTPSSSFTLRSEPSTRLFSRSRSCCLGSWPKRICDSL